MRRKFYLLLILILPQVSLQAKCYFKAGVRIYNNGIPTHYDRYDAGIPIDAFIASGDSVKFYAEMDDMCAGPGFVTLFFNGDTIYYGQTGNGHPPYSLTVFDTGYYKMDAWLNGNHLIFELTLGYFIGTGIQNDQVPPSFQITTSISSGIFKVSSSESILKQILVADSRGYMVIQATKNFSVIDLTNFSSGIYFYAITDEKQNVWRGKIMKQ